MSYQVSEDRATSLFRATQKKQWHDIQIQTMH
jgi:hypothetical protein